MSWCKCGLVDMYKVSATRKPKARGSNLAQGRICDYPFFSLSLPFFFLHVYFNVLSVMSVPTSRNTEILSYFPTINYPKVTHM